MALTTTLDSKIPPGPLEQKWADHKGHLKLVNPANKRKFTILVVGSGLAGASAAASFAELGYNVKCFCFQDSPRRAHSHRRAGRHQRREELPERRRQRLPAVLRHRQGRRLPLARGQRLPPGPGVGQHHRPVRRAGRAVRPRVRRPARQPLLRRRPGLAHVLRPRPDRPAAAARRLPGAGAPDRRRQGEDVPAHRDARRGGRRRPGARASSSATWSPAGSTATPGTPWCWRPAATATSSTCRPTPRARTSPPPGAPTDAAPSSPTPATRRSTPPASRLAATTSPS